MRVHTVYRLSFYGQLLEQLSVALLPRRASILWVLSFSLLDYSLLVLYYVHINDDDGDIQAAVQLKRMAKLLWVSSNRLLK